MSNELETLRRQIMANPVAARMLVRGAVTFERAFDDASLQAVIRALCDAGTMQAILASEEAQHMTLAEYVAATEPARIEGMDETAKTVLKIAGL
ncbi:MAG: hypothetical protein HZT43_03550 [Exiguobacterium profundum]|nr:MAG: hypothetical protein HZT43_03550 [Exiguobacterium profundum]